MISIISAVAKNNTIGKDNDLPWHLPEDLKRFKRLTVNNTVLMGRKTFESIFDRLGKALPKRTSLIITRNTNYSVPEGCFVYNSIEEAIQKHKYESVYIIGGASIYEQSMDLANELEITHLDDEYAGDTFFPEIDPETWEVTKKEPHEGYRFVTYKRK